MFFGQLRVKQDPAEMLMISPLMPLIQSLSFSLGLTLFWRFKEAESLVSVKLTLH